MSSSEKLRILLDSTYILPIVGVEVEGIERTLMVLRKLRKERKAEFYYTPFNIIEILGKIAKLKHYNKEVVDTGLSLVEEEFKLVYPTVRGYIKALNLRKKGFRDMIDLLLYATALTCNLLLLTRDNTLINFLEKMGEKKGSILYEEKLIKRYS